MGKAEYTNLDKIKTMDEAILGLSTIIYNTIAGLKNNGIINEDEAVALINDPSKIKDYSSKDGITTDIVNGFLDVNKKRLEALKIAKETRESDEAKEELEAKLDLMDNTINSAKKEKQRLTKLREKATNEDEIKLLDLEIEKQNRIIANYVLNKEYNALMFKTGASEKIAVAVSSKYGRGADFDDTISKINGRITENEFKNYNDSKIIYMLNKKGTKLAPAKKEPEKKDKPAKKEPEKKDKPAKKEPEKKDNTGKKDKDNGKGKAEEGEIKIVKKEKNHRLKEFCKKHKNKLIAIGLTLALLAGVGIYSHNHKKDKIDIDSPSVQETVEPKASDDVGKTEDASNENENGTPSNNGSDNSNTPSSEPETPTSGANSKVEVPPEPAEEKEPSHVPNRNNEGGTTSESANNNGTSDSTQKVDPLFGSYTIGSNVPLFGSNDIYYNYDTNEVVYKENAASNISNGESQQTSSSSDVAREIEDYYKNQISTNIALKNSASYNSNHDTASSAIGTSVENIRSTDGSDQELVKQTVERAKAIIDGDNEGMTAREIAMVCVDGISATAYADNPNDFEDERKCFENVYDKSLAAEANAPIKRMKPVRGGY